MDDKLNILFSTACELRDLLTQGTVTSADLVDIYLTQIAKHNHEGFKLHAVISTADRNSAVEYAKKLDAERQGGLVRSPFHGIPILVKDVCKEPQSLDELIEFNKAHADVEFVEGNDNQLVLEAGRDSKITKDEYGRNFQALRHMASSNVLSILEEYGVDVILGPCDSRTGSVGAAAGFPVGNLPLGFAHFNGRPSSLHMIAPANQEAKMLQVMSVWAVTFPGSVRPPPRLNM